ncbi:hypothetical protein [Streptococcus uberis]|uniref:hypothetical protein n=1 Tax=Streptococcus uberis TaxID=1349 RepID=UPI000620428A|nr:hypothetical protein [Streptococcus uberis]QBX12098.1 hypothetical protein JavanS634_0005 [Streptococcus satellite phage Javan634]KKF41382.1 hypothetical protein AF61_01935 [Streptococcus uberis EF20/0145]MCK1158319.1 hypothetical protein [Streptococcus uberis]MCK1202119.1 hypothetical protein [Streptococcus uberis]MCK1224180.1 hypothetical protein [Streptococcus uberis]
MLTGPNLKIQSRIIRNDFDLDYVVKPEFIDTWTKDDQKLLDEWNRFRKEMREDRAKFFFDEDID